MRRMITSKKEKQLIDMTESVFESGTLEIPSGTSMANQSLLPFKPGYQYKIYSNVKAVGVNEISRFESEIGVSQSYIDFFNADSFIVFAMAPVTVAGITSFRISISKGTNELLVSLRCNGTSTSNISWRYLITRSKIYF